MAQQLIYTSARKLPDAGRSGFGSVARSRSLSPLVVGAIERLSQFASLRGYDRKRVIFAHRRMTVGNSRFHLLTSIRDAGADYTGRTNHIAQHLVVAPDEAAKLAAIAINPGDILGGYRWLNSWDRAPKLFDDSDDADLGGTSRSREPGQRNAWAEATGIPLYARLIASRTAPKSGVLVLPDSAEPLPLIAEALAEVESQTWAVTFTTCLEQADELADFNWIITPSSLFGAIQQRCGSRSMLRADQPAELPVPEERVRTIPTPTAIRKSAGSGPPIQPAVLNKSESVPLASGGETPYSPLKIRLKEQQVERATAEAPTQPVSYSDPVRQETLPTRKSSRMPKTVLIAASATTVIVIGLLLMVRINLGGEGESGGDLPPPKGGGDPALKITAQDDLMMKLKSYEIDSAEAKKIASEVAGKDPKGWSKFFEELKKWSKDPTWEGVAKLSDPPDREAVGEPLWLTDLCESKTGISGLKLLAQKRERGRLVLPAWKEFDKIALGLGNDGGILHRWNPTLFATLASEELSRLVEDDSATSELIKQVAALGLWGRDPFLEIFRKEFEHGLRDAKSIKLLDILMEGLKDCELFKSKKEELANLKTVIELTKGPLHAYKENAQTLGEDVLPGYLEELAKDDGTPRILEEKLIGLRDSDGDPDRKGVASILMKQPAAPKGSESIPYKGPECARYIFKREDLEAGTIKSPLFAYLIKSKASTKKGGLERYDLGSTDTLQLGNKKVKLLIEQKSGEDVFWWKPKGKKIFGVTRDGTLRWEERLRKLSKIQLTVGSAKEYFAFTPSVSTGESETPLWGEAGCKLEPTAKALRITGELGSRLKEISGHPTLRIRFNEVKSYDLAFDGKHYGVERFFLPRRVALELQRYPPSSKETKGKKEPEPGLTVLNRAILELEKELEKEQKPQTLKTEKTKGVGDRKKAAKKLRDEARSNLYHILADIYPKEEDIEGEYKGFKTPKKENQFPNSFVDIAGESHQTILIKFAKYVVKLSDKKEILEENEKLIQGSLGAIHSVEVWTTGVNDGERLWLFEGSVDK